MNQSERPAFSPTSGGFPFNPLLFMALLVITAVLGLLSNVNSNPYGHSGIVASVRYGLTHGDVYLILTAVLTLVLVLWLLLALVTGRFKSVK